MKNFRLTCIGAGNMGVAFVKGLVDSGALAPGRITITDRDRTDCGTDVENGTRCQSLDDVDRMCACWENVWDCGSKPNHW